MITMVLKTKKKNYNELIRVIHALLWTAVSPPQNNIKFLTFSNNHNDQIFTFSRRIFVVWVKQSREIANVQNFENWKTWKTGFTVKRPIFRKVYSAIISIPYTEVTSCLHLLLVVTFPSFHVPTVVCPTVSVGISSHGSNF